MIESVPCWAPTSPPETGASSVAIPRSANCMATVGWIVDMSIHRSGWAATMVSATDSTASESGSIVITMSVRAASSRLTLRAPSIAFGVRLWTTTSCPAATRLRAMGSPMHAETDEADHWVTIHSRVSTVARVGLYSSPTQPV